MQTGFRADEQLEKRIESICEKIQEQRGPYAGEVTKSEALRILVELGADLLEQENM